MKKPITIFILLVFISFNAVKATTHTISVSSTALTPSTVNAVVGDTIEWITACACPHTTISNTIPTCATAWSYTFPAVAGSTYSIVVPCAGTYNYKNTTYGFSGIINVSNATGIASISGNNPVSVSYPNPFSNKLTISFETLNADLITLYNGKGEKISTNFIQKNQAKTELNTTDLAEGIYFYSIFKNGIVIETRKIIKN